MADHQWRIVQFYKLFLSTHGGSHQCESFMSRVEINNQFASLGLSLPGALHAVTAAHGVEPLTLQSLHITLQWCLCLFMTYKGEKSTRHSANILTRCLGLVRSPSSSPT